MSIEDGQHEIGEIACPSCGKSIEMATGITGVDAPKPGDVTVCFYCVSIMEFVTVGSPGSVRTSMSEPSPERKKKLMEQSSELRATVLALKRKRT